MIVKKILLFAIPFFSFFISFSQAQQAKQKINGWHLLDEEKDGYHGISLQKAYDLLKGRQSKTVIVAVLDSVIDTAHEDLRNILWRNEREINGNGIDDDKNGYVDDIYGWNFCGSKSGENLARNSYETARVYHGWKREFEGKNEKDIPADKKFLYSQWIKAANIINKDYDDAYKEQTQIVNVLEAAEASSSTITNYLGRKEFNAADVKALLKNDKRAVAFSAEFWVDM